MSTAVQLRNRDLPQGIHRWRSLPEAPLGRLWESIKVEQSLKDRLLAQAVLNFQLRGRIDRSVIPLHGVILLVGPPGTGKTSLALGLANKAAASFTNSQFQLLEVEPHALTSSAMGKTQRAVSDLFGQSIREAASRQPTIVLLDEVETLAVDRSRLSMDANPIDVHRATDAVLVQLDALAEEIPHLLFIATSNFPKAIDQAFISRCDLVAEVPLPNGDARQQILIDCLTGLDKTYPQLSAIIDTSQIARCVAASEGLDGRAIRKAVGNALASSPEKALKPSTVTAGDVVSALRDAAKQRTDKATP